MLVAVFTACETGGLLLFFAAKIAEQGEYRVGKKGQ